MKQLALIAFTLFISVFSVSSQFLNLADAKKIKSSKVIMGLTDNEEVNTIFRAALASHWSITKIDEELPLKEAILKIKKDGSVTVIMLGVDVTKKSNDVGGGWTNYTRASAVYIGINTNGSQNANLIQQLPSWTDDQLAFGLTSLQDMIATIIDNNLASNMKVKEEYQKRAPSLKANTLILDKTLLESGLTEATIKTLYPHPFSIVSHEDWVAAIVDKTEKISYINTIPVPVGDVIAYISYVVDAGTQQTQAFYRVKDATVTKKTFKEILSF